MAAGYNITYWTREDATLDHDVHLVGRMHGILSEKSSPPTGTYAGVGQVGYRTACAIRQSDDPNTDGTLEYWGDEPKGIAVPSELDPVKDLVVYSGSDSHACAIKTDDTVACW